MWTLCDSGNGFSGDIRVSSPNFEKLRTVLDAIASTHGLSDAYAGMWEGDLLWCTGITGDRFREESDDPEILRWRNEPSGDRCWDIHVFANEKHTQIAVDFEGRSLVRHALEIDNHRPTVADELALGEDFDTAAKKLGALLDAMLSDILQPAKTS